MLVIVLCYCLYAVLLLLCCTVIVLLCYYLCCPMYLLCVLYHCHRVLTQLQSTNISIFMDMHLVLPGSRLSERVADHSSHGTHIDYPDSLFYFTSVRLGTSRDLASSQAATAFCYVLSNSLFIIIQLSDAVQSKVLTAS